MSEDPISTQREAVIEECINKLGEYFDAVQILATWQEQSTTQKLTVGAGNWYARQGMAQYFISQDVAQENARQLSQAMGAGVIEFFEEDDDDEDDMESLGSA